jgi:hypothetical protein
MKNLNGLRICIAMLTAILFFAGCPMDSGDDAKSGAALVTGITVAGEPVTGIPEPVPQDLWTSVDFNLTNLESGQVGDVIVRSSLTDARIDVTASAGAKVKYAAVDTDTPQAFQDANTITLISNGYLCIQVTSENGKVINYYVVQTRPATSITSLTSITVGGIAAAELGTPNADWQQAAAGSVGLSNATKNDAEVEVTKTVANQTVKYAKVSGDGAPSFGTDTSFSFEDGDFLYIEVTAENGTTKTVYKLEILIGRDTTLSAISIGGVSVTNLGTPAATLAGATAGTVLFNTPQPSDGYAVVVTPTDEDADVKWAAVTTDTNTATFGETTPIVFTDGGYLYVEVTAANGTNKAYYKIRVNLLMTATIKYGTPTIAANTIDAIWNSVTETYSIAKVFPTDSTPDYIANPTTTGVAKALFDEEGLYVYVEVTDPSVDSSGGGNHEKDSVELFINEGVDVDGKPLKTPISYNNTGGQYRVGANGAISGDPAAAGNAIDPSKVSAWTTEDGYIVIFQAPWRFLNLYPLEDGKKIGFELQINACSDGGREGVMVWNNIAHGNYQDVTDYGEATLDAGDHVFVIHAKEPIISAHPAGKGYIGSSTTAVPLTVTAASPDGGNLTYQWYSNTTNSYEGGAVISGESGTSYTPNIAADGTKYYWVEITNTITDNGDGGTKTATARSGIAGIVVSSVPLVEKIEAAASSVPAYRFSPPQGSTWSDYKKMTFTIMVTDEASYNQVSARAHIVGNYSASNFGTSGIYSNGNWGGERILNIEGGTGTSTIKTILGDPGLNVWKVLEYDTSTFSGSTVPAANATGPFYFGLGLTLNPNNLDADNKGDTVAYYIKDIALVKENNDKLYADDLFVSFGSTSLGQIWCKFDVNNGLVVRTLEPEPSAPSED